MRVRVDNSEWSRANNGRSPRGRGQWMFRNTAEWGAEGMATFETSFMTFTSARNEARTWAAANGFETVWVCR